MAGLLAANPVLGWVAVALFAAFLLALAAVTLRELAAYGRLARLDGVHKAALAALASGDARAARQVTDRLITLYGDRPETEWGRVRLAERRDETFDVDTLLHLAEAELLAPLDQLARREIEAAARQVATVTALVPLALADVAGGLAPNLPGVINGALTARVGIAAMEVCRPLPFARLPRPKVSNLVSRGLAGLFGRKDVTSDGDQDVKT